MSLFRNPAFALFVLLLLFSITPTFAQDAVPPDVPSDTSVAPGAPLVDIEWSFETIRSAVFEAAAIIFAAVSAVVSGGAVGGAFSPAVTALVGFLKNIPLVRNFRVSTILLLATTLVWLGAAAAVQFNFQERYSSLMEFIAAVLPPIGVFLGSLIGAPLVHEWAANKGLPILGDKRSRAAPDGERSEAPLDGLVGLDGLPASGFASAHDFLALKNQVAILQSQIARG